MLLSYQKLMNHLNKIYKIIKMKINKKSKMLIKKKFKKKNIKK